MYDVGVTLPAAALKVRADLGEALHRSARNVRDRHGVAPLLTGIGFIVLASGLSGPMAMRRPQVTGPKSVKHVAVH